MESIVENKYFGIFLLPTSMEASLATDLISREDNRIRPLLRQHAVASAIPCKGLSVETSDLSSRNVVLSKSSHVQS
jgi:hypothetical protein